MDDEEIDIYELARRYEQMQALGKKIYFDADEFALLADFYHAQGNTQRAYSLIDEGLRMHPQNTELLIQRAKRLVYESMYDEAYDFLQQFSDDENIDVPLLKIESMLHLGMINEANILIEKLMKLDLTNEDFYLFLTEIGYVFNDIDDYDRAISFLEQSLQIEEDNPEVLVDLAYAYEMKNDFEKAILYNNKLLDIDTFSFDAWVNIGKLYSLADDHAKAVEAFDFALSIREDDVQVMKMKALSLYLNDNVEEALRIFKECLGQSPEDESLYDSLMEGYSVMEQYDEMQRIIDLKQQRFGDKGIGVKRANAYIEEGKYEEARAIFNHLPEEDKNSFEYYFLEGELAMNDDDINSAEIAFMKAALLSPDNEAVIDRLANICVIKERYPQAVEYLEQLLQIDPDFPTVKSRLALIRFEIGVKEPFDKIMEEFSDNELRLLLNVLLPTDQHDYSKFSREKMLQRLNEARENRVMFKNIKY